jgi:hypothetical protein
MKDAKCVTTMNEAQFKAYVAAQPGMSAEKACSLAADPDSQGGFNAVNGCIVSKTSPARFNEAKFGKYLKKAVLQEEFGHARQWDAFSPFYPAAGHSKDEAITAYWYRDVLEDATKLQLMELELEEATSDTEKMQIKATIKYLADALTTHLTFLCEAAAKISDPNNTWKKAAESCKKIAKRWVSRARNLAR